MRHVAATDVFLAAIASASCAASVAFAGQPRSELTQGLTLYVPFDGVQAPKFCQGKPDISLAAAFLGAGRVAGGVEVIGSASVSLSALGNFHRPAGTLAFWHKPLWRPNEPLKSHRMILKQSNFQITWYGPKRILFFMTGKTQPGQGFKWDYSVASTIPRTWQPGEWRHFAITWDSQTGRKRLFLHGTLASEGSTPWLRDDPVRVAETIVLGSPSAQGGYDEWAIWDRVLSDDEIALLAKQPEAAARALRAAKPMEAEPQPPVRFGLATFKVPSEAIVDPGETMRLPSEAQNLTPDALEVELHLSVVDAFGQAQRQWDETLRLAPEERKPLALAVSAAAHGAFKVCADFDWQGRRFRRDLGGFAVWPKRFCRPSPDSFFGHHVNSWFGGAFLRQAERLGLSWQRGHNMLQSTWMTRVQPEPGAAQWVFHDHVDACRGAGLSVLGEFFATPYWAGDPPAAKPANPRQYPRGTKPRLDVFERYVRMTVARFSQSIRVWEVWNEPEVSLFWHGTPEEFGQLAQVACRAAKEVDPACTVLVGGFTGVWGREWYERAGKAGAFRHADGISYHGYARSVQELRRKLELFRGIGREFSTRGGAFELWDSEWGVQDTTFYVDADFPGLGPRRLLPAASYLDGAARVVKADCISMALGVKRSFYYLHNTTQGPGAYQNGSAIETTRAPRPKLMARVALEFLTRGAEVETLVERQDFTALVLAKTPAQSRAAVWLNDAAEAVVTAAWPARMELLDLFANQLTWESRPAVRVSAIPVYLDARAPASQLSALLRRAEVSRARGQ